MKRLSTIFSLFIIVSATAFAQPAKSRVQTARNTGTSTAAKKNGAANKGGTTTKSRAELMFPTAADVPAEVTWRRDMYRALDLTQDENAALYFPVEAKGDNVNLFALLFKLLNRGTIPAYQYTLDGNEDFSQANRLHFKDMLDRYSIPYEINGNAISVLDADIPSSEVLSYYVKESSYYDQNTATYHSRITALCPVMHRAPEFDLDNIQKSPLFWVKYDDIKTYLAGKSIMISNLNNASSMSIDDFFATNRYKGDIYKTTNMQGKTLQEQFPSKDGMKAEQQRIEKQMTDFEEHIWKTPVDSVELAKKDSIAAIANKKTKPVRAQRATQRRGSNASTEAAPKPSKEKSSSSSSSSNAPRVSVRRQRH